MDFLHVFLLPHAWAALLTLAFLEIVLEIDNIVFLSIITSKLPANQQQKGRIAGLATAMALRILLLFGISLLMRLTEPIFSFGFSWLSGKVSGQSLIMFFGGLFLLYKSVSEIHGKFESTGRPVKDRVRPQAGFAAAIVQIGLLDIVLSFDSVLTAVGMVSFDEFGYGGAMAVMVTAVVAAVLVMMLFSGPVARFINGHPAIQMMALSFLMLIGVMLLVESTHLAGIVLFGTAVQEIPKGYIYFAIAFSILVEFLNMRLTQKSKQNNGTTSK